MSELNICRICLRTEAKGYKYERFQLKYFYEEVTANKVNDDDGLPQWFCFECAAMLHKFHKFKEKCFMGLKILKEMLWKGHITYEQIYKIDSITKPLQSTLQTIIVTDRVKTFTIKDLEMDTHIKIEKTADKIQFEEESIINNMEFNSEHQIKLDMQANENIGSTGFINSSNDQNDYNKPIQTYSPISIIVEESNIVQLQSENIKTTKSKHLEMSESLKEFGNKLSTDNWKKVNLTEDEALKEFRAKAEDPKYLDAVYKCRDCIKGFSKKDMLNRHVQSRHSEDLGPHECRFCRMRFKWNCHLRKHIQQHFTKYECLRCHIVFNLDTSAFLHEEYHSGTTKKCIHCNEEFRHMTTYYTHLRTHRSAHVCPACGASFVSPAGLRQHRRRKHRDNALESEDDEDGERDTFCERCNIRFDTRKAFEEHLFHSAMHTEVIKREEQDDVTLTKKILGKRLRAKITNELRTRKSDFETSIPVKSKRRKKIKRKNRKPSTCHQCGKSFDTQAACMKHHLAEHPRTSFYAPNERHICELCGASLAPGSVAVHQNMHSKEKLHTCDTCGRQFHSGVGLKRHLVTHTGEKPFGCPLCDKRFTQSNSMKLHYRTFHLKQPYPKRTRKKKKEDNRPTTEQEESYEEESDSLPEPEVEPAPPEVPTEPAVDNLNNVHAVGLNVEVMEQENMHYLTLS